MGKYDGTPLQSRWQEAISFGAGPEASDFWVRDSDDVVNIIWLNPDGIRDIAMITHPLIMTSPSDGDEEVESEDYQPSIEDATGATEELPLRGETGSGGNGEMILGAYREAMFNFVPLRNIASFEVREGDDIARHYGLEVSGNKLVHVILNAPMGHLYWVANSPSEGDRLGQFFTSVLSAYLYTR